MDCERSDVSSRRFKSSRVERCLFNHRAVSHIPIAVAAVTHGRLHEIALVKGANSPFDRDRPADAAGGPAANRHVPRAADTDRSWRPRPRQDRSEPPPSLSPVAGEVPRAKWSRQPPSHRRHCLLRRTELPGSDPSGSRPPPRKRHPEDLSRISPRFSHIQSASRCASREASALIAVRDHDHGRTDVRHVVILEPARHAGRENSGALLQFDAGRGDRLQRFLRGVLVNDIPE